MSSRFQSLGFRSRNELRPLHELIAGTAAEVEQGAAYVFRGARWRCAAC
jgi:hypothetical protein